MNADETKKTIAAKLLKALKEVFAEEKQTIETKFGTATLPDSTVIKWEGDIPMPGQPVTVVGADGVETPVPDGEYIFEDGAKLVTQAGLCVEFIPAQANTPEEPAAPATTPNEAMSEGSTTAVAKEVIERVERVQKFAEDEIDALKKNLTTLSESFAAIQKENETLKSEYKSVSEKFAAATKAVEDAIAEDGDKPQTKKEVIENFRTDEKKETIEEIRKRIFKL